MDELSALDIIDAARRAWLADGRYQGRTYVEDRDAFYAELRRDALPRWLAAGRSQDAFEAAMVAHARQDWVRSGGDAKAFDDRLKGATGVARRRYHISGCFASILGLLSATVASVFAKQLYQECGGLVIVVMIGGLLAAGAMWVILKAHKRLRHGPVPAVTALNIGRRTDNK